MQPAPETTELIDYVAWIGTVLALQTGPEPTVSGELVERLIAIEARIRTRTDGPAQRLRDVLGLTASELQVVLVLAAAALDDGVRRQLAERDGGAGDPTLTTLRALVYGTQPSVAALRELAADAPLRRRGLIERTDGGGTDRHESTLTWSVSRRLLAWLLCDPQLASPIPGLVSDTRQVAVDALAIEPRAVTDVRAAVRAPGSVVVVAGMPGLGRRTLLAAAAREAGRVVVQIDARRLARDPALLASQLRAIALECKLAGGVPLIAHLDALVDERGDRLELVGSTLAPLIDGSILVTCGVHRPVIAWGERPVILIELGRASSAQLATLWHAALGQGTDDDAALLSELYPLAPALIHRAAAATLARAGDRGVQPDDLAAGVRAVLDDKLGQFARRISVTQGWDDLVLAHDQLDPIIELLARVRSRRKVYEQWGFAAKVGRGLGVSALFSGPPGTGKTMVAALIARDLGLELYQVDMAKIVSKYIGETEKNLGALFDAAEAGHAIVLFDEADALFGKRTEVKSSNDRHANLETNYLLQRLETFTGICLLTSNHETHIDPAFQRRLSLHVRFELPDELERARLWQATLPAAAPVAIDIDFAALGRRYSMSGGYIRNAALRAAFLAADEDGTITAAHLERAARVEYEGMGKIAA